MKTTYLKPETIIVEVALQNLMIVSNGNEGTVNSVSFSTEDYSGGDVLSRRGSVWDDED